MENIIRKAIRERIVVQFNYEGRKEVVEPYVLGCEKNSDAIKLLGYRIITAEKDHPWKLFAYNKISDMTLVNVKAYSYRVGIARNFNKIKKIIYKEEK